MQYGAERCGMAASAVGRQGFLRFASGAVRNLSRMEQNKAIVLDALLKQLLHLCETCGVASVIATNITGALANLALLVAVQA